MRNVIPRRVPAVLKLLALIITAALLGACSEASGTATDSYVLSVTATGAVGAGGFDVTIRDEGATVDLATTVGATSPAALEVTGTTDYSTLQSVVVIVTGNDMPDTQTMTVTVTYTENSYLPPVTQTVDTTTRTNSTGGLTALEYRLPLTLPVP